MGAYTGIVEVTLKLLESRLTLTEEDFDDVGGVTEVVGGSLTLLGESLVLDETDIDRRRVKLLDETLALLEGQ